MSLMDLSANTDDLLLIPPDFFMSELANVSSGSDVGSSVSKHIPYPHVPFTSPETRRKLLRMQTPADSSFRIYCPVNGDVAPIVHSTPKTGAFETSTSMLSTKTPPVTMRSEDKNVISEIDRFLYESHPHANSQLVQEKNCKNLSSAEETLREFRSKCTVNGDRKSSGAVRSSLNMFGMQTNGGVVEEPLLSLSTMWGIEEQRCNVEMSLQEEQMRRRHCEHTIQQLQQTLLDREQRIAVAMRVDSRKDEAIVKLKADNATAVANADTLKQSLECAVQRFADEHKLIDGKCTQLQRDNDRLQRDLGQAHVAQRHLQECNELLEQKISHVTKTTAELRSMHQQQIAELEVRVRNALRNEELSGAELTKLRDANERLQAVANKTEADAKTTEQQWLLKEQTLHQELNTQRVSLKTVYQEQLNEAVARKLADFQAQVDSVEATLRSEGRQRERLIAERAIRQLELIVQKNEQECALLSEKYSAEIELYRIQLVNAAKTNETLTQKVNTFQAKRTDMAERLHTVMETQWHRALEIIASPTNVPTDTANGNATSKPNKNTAMTNDASIESTLTKAESDSFHTPKSGATATMQQRRPSRQPIEKGTNDPLQHYIDMLLEKSPREYDNFAGILSNRTGNKQPTIHDDGIEHRNRAGNRTTKQAWK